MPRKIEARHFEAVAALGSGARIQVLFQTAMDLDGMMLVRLPRWDPAGTEDGAGRALGWLSGELTDYGRKVVERRGRACAHQ